MQFVADGTNAEIIDGILSNIIAQEKDEYTHKLKTIEKEAVLWIQAGINPPLFCAILNSYTDLPLTETDFDTIFKNEETSSDYEEAEQLLENLGVEVDTD